MSKTKNTVPTISPPREIKLFGKEKEAAFLKEHHLNNTMPHGLLLSGEKGLGKKLFAEYAACLMLCENGSGGVPCFSCKSCRKALLCEHPDIVFARGEKYNADTLRECVRGASLRPNDGELRVIVFEDCDEMSDIHQNILLKTIEEPLPFNRFIFTCGSTSDILPTVMSRLVNIRFERPDAKSCKSCLVYNGISEKQADSAIEKFGTNPGQILEILGDAKRVKLYESAEKIAAAITEHDEYSAAAEFCAYTDRSELFELILLLYEQVSRAVISQSGTDKTAAALRARLPLKSLFALSEELLRLYELNEINVNVKMLQSVCTARIFAAAES